MTITEFLEARIAEDEQAAQDSLERGFGGWEWLADLGVNFEARTHIVRHDPARVLAECRAKRAIVDVHGEVSQVCAECSNEMHPCRTVRLIAAVYADHPDYQQEWRP